MDAQNSKQEYPHPETLKNETPNIVFYVISTVAEYLQSYGWFILLGLCGLWFVWQKVEPRLRSWQREKEDEQHKKYDSNQLLSRQEAMDAARRRMQEQHDSQAQVFAEKQAEKDKKKLQEKLEDWDRHQQGRGYRSKYRPEEESGNSTVPKPKSKNVYKQTDYNPLTGSDGGASCSYRPDRRSNRGG